MRGINVSNTIKYNNKNFIHIFSKVILIAIVLLFCRLATAVELSDVVNFEVVDWNNQTHKIELKLVTKDDFKIYRDNLAFELKAPGMLPENLKYSTNPKAKLVFDPFSNKNKYVFENGTSFTFTTSTNLQNDDTMVVSVQACSEGVCLLPGKLVFSLEGGEPGNFDGMLKSFETEIPSAVQAKPKVLAQLNQPETKKKSNTLAEMTENFLQKGSLFLFPLLFLAGLLTNLTPCVYPMIPITIGVMNQFGKGQKFKFQLSLIYVLGMILSYSLLGVVAAMTGQVFGSQLASPLFNAAIASIMILLGFAMLGLFDLSFLQRLSYKIPFFEKSPVLAVGTMGAISGLVAAPCTGPILSMILVLIAQTHAPVTGFVYMFCFALGFGVPYVVLGLASQKITQLPKMPVLSFLVKIFFACLMFALAAYFVKGILSSTHFFNFFYTKPRIVDVIVVLVLLFLFAGIKASKFGNAKKIVSTLSYLGIVFSLSLLCLWFTLYMSNAFVKPYIENRAVAFEDMLKTSQINWETDLNAAMDDARKHNKKVLVDVWAEWCTACLEMEATTWKDPKVIKILQEKFVAVKLDYTSPDKTLADDLNAWHVVGLPAILVFSPSQPKTPVEVNQGILTTRDLLKKLSKY